MDNNKKYSNLKINSLFLLNSDIDTHFPTGPITTQYDSSGTVLDKGVRESNRIAISLVNNTIPNLKFYLPNLLQFHK